MIVFLTGNRVTGFHDTATAADMTEYPLDFIEIDVPDDVRWHSADKYVMYDPESVSLYVVDTPPKPETPEDKISRLESELSASVDANLTTMSALADVFEMVLSLQYELSGGSA